MTTLTSPQVLPPQNTETSSSVSRSGARSSLLEICPDVVNVAGIMLIANVHLTSLSTLPGFRHGAMQRTATTRVFNPAAPSPKYSTVGLEADPDFQMSYVQSVEAGRKFEATIRNDWVELDIDY
jgi:hypothetical protein